MKLEELFESSYFDPTPEAAASVDHEWNPENAEKYFFVYKFNFENDSVETLDLYYDDKDEYDDSWEDFVDTQTHDLGAEEGSKWEGKEGETNVVTFIGEYNEGNDDFGGFNIKGAYIVLSDRLLSPDQVKKFDTDADKEVTSWASDAAESHRDAEEYAKDPYAYYGVSRSDFM